ncbi:HTH-type transcriptional regulator VirS [Amycolatopsis sp. YIM 10]|nr:HTH-type transcriptional regulator VirS [Amycolatopsis sp. YIM 10]
MSLIRGTSLSGFPVLVEQLGGCPAELLRRRRIPEAAVGDFESFIDYICLLEVLEDAARDTGAPTFGRLLAEVQGIEILGSVGAAARTAPTVGDAMVTFARYLGAYSPAIEVRLTPLDDRPGLTTFEFRILLQRLSPHPQGIELALGVSLRVFRLLLGATWSPLRVHLPHTALTSRSDYTTYFGAPPRFEESFAGFTLRSSDLDRQLTPDPTTHAALVAYLKTVTPPGEAGVATAVAELIRRLLPTGDASLDLIAGHLGLHPRTLQRRLAAGGATFAEVVDAVRRDVAERLLRDTDMSLGHLARELGYAEQGALTRASHRWFGAAPLTHRRALRHPSLRSPQDA